MNLILSKVSRLTPILLFIMMFLCLYAPFTVIDDGGYLAVRDEATKQVCRSDVRVTDLPDSDHRLLADGIVCNNTAELAKILENFIY